MELRSLPLFVAAIGSALVFVHGQSESRPDLQFEVVSIKPATPQLGGGRINPLPGGQTYCAQAITVKSIVMLMYKLKPEQISGGPAWIDHEVYDIEAKAARPSSLDDLHAMFKNLLASEFKLKLHKETKEGPVYALIVDKSGLKMKVNETENVDLKTPMTATGFGKAKGVRVPMSYFCWFLSFQVDRPVIDKTGLGKYYDFTLEWDRALPPGDPERDSAPPPNYDAPTIFDAIRGQLGLKLEPQKGPMEIFVIDHVERPVAN